MYLPVRDYRRRVAVPLHRARGIPDDPSNSGNQHAMLRCYAAAKWHSGRKEGRTAGREVPRFARAGPASE